MRTTTRSPGTIRWRLRRPLLRHCRCKLRQHDLDVLGENPRSGYTGSDDDGAFGVVLPPQGIVLEQELAGGDEEERCFIYRKVDDGSLRHGAAEFWRRARVDGYVQDGDVVWHRGGVDDS